MSTTWEKLFAAAMAAERRGDPIEAANLADAARHVERGAQMSAKAALRRAGSNAFRSDAEEAFLREENQRRFYGGGRGR